MTKAGKPSFDELFSDFARAEGCPPEHRRPVTVWIPAEYKARFDQLQKSSRRGFGKKVRELILAAIELAESKAP